MVGNGIAYVFLLVLAVVSVAFVAALFVVLGLTISRALRADRRDRAADPRPGADPPPTGS